jgi:hypothetical protein
LQARSLPAARFFCQPLSAEHRIGYFAAPVPRLVKCCTNQDDCYTNSEHPAL